MASLAYGGGDQRLRGAVGMTITVAVHAIAIAVLLSNRVEAPLQLPTLGVRVIAPAANDSPARPLPVSVNLVVPTTIAQVATPEIVLADTPSAPSHAITVTSVPPAAVDKSSADEGDIPPRFDADYLDNPVPRYPPMSRRLREKGVVLLRVLVTPKGLPEAVELKRSSGSPRLDDSALAAVRQWKFVPAQRAGQPIASWVVVPVEFFPAV